MCGASLSFSVFFLSLNYAMWVINKILGNINLSKVTFILDQVMLVRCEMSCHSFLPSFFVRLRILKFSFIYYIGSHIYSYHIPQTRGISFV